MNSVLEIIIILLFTLVSVDRYKESFLKDRPSIHKSQSTEQFFIRDILDINDT
jgi:hypothetical protein